MREVGRRIYNIFGVIIPGITFMLIFITFIISIVSRYFFKAPVTWSYEISVLGYMWTMFFGVGKAMEKDEHVVFGLVYDACAPLGQYILKTIYNIFLVILILICFIPSYQSLVGKQMVTGVLKMPYSIVFAPFIYMLADVVVHSLLNVKKAYFEYKDVKGEA
ncbi:MAG: TRAP transporter small permease [Lachnospiraceae bacterium]